MKQHYVPEVYLRLFANPRGNFFQLNLERKKVREMNVSAVCYEKDFYDVRDAALKRQLRITDDRFLERNAFRYENILIKVLSIFKDRPKIVSNDYTEALINIYLRIKQRNPFYLKVLTNDKLEDIYKAALIDLKKDITEHPILKEIEFNIDDYANAFFEQERSDPDKLKKMHLRSIFDVLRMDSLSFKDSFDKLYLMNFTVLNAGEDDFFIVSDNPGFTLKWMDNEGNQAGVYNLDLLNFHQIYFPLNSKQALLFDQFDPFLSEMNFRYVNYVNSPSSQVEALNKASLFCTNGKVFCENRDYLMNFIDKL